MEDETGSVEKSSNSTDKEARKSPIKKEKREKREKKDRKDRKEKKEKKDRKEKKHRIHEKPKEEPKEELNIQDNSIRRTTSEEIEVSEPQIRERNFAVARAKHQSVDSSTNVDYANYANFLVAKYPQKKGFFGSTVDSNQKNIIVTKNPLLNYSKDSVLKSQGKPPGKQSGDITPRSLQSPRTLLNRNQTNGDFTQSKNNMIDSDPLPRNSSSRQLQSSGENTPVLSKAAKKDNRKTWHFESPPLDIVDNKDNSKKSLEDKKSGSSPISSNLPHHGPTTKKDASPVERVLERRGSNASSSNHRFSASRLSFSSSGVASSSSPLSSLISPRIRKERTVSTTEKVTHRDPSLLTKIEIEEGLIIEDDGSRAYVLGGSVVKLIQSLIYTQIQDKVISGSEYIEELLFTYRYFTTPELLIEALCNTYTKEKPEVQLKIVNIMKKWVDNHFDDIYNDKRLLDTFVNTSLDMLGREMTWVYSTSQMNSTVSQLKSSGLVASNNSNSGSSPYSSLSSGSSVPSPKIIRHSPISESTSQENKQWIFNLISALRLHLIHKVKEDFGPMLEFVKKHKEIVDGEMLEALIKKSGIIKDRKRGLSKYKQSFIGTECIDWISSTLEIESRSRAVNLCSELPVRFRQGRRDSTFGDDLCFYSFGDEAEVIQNFPKPFLIKNSKITNFLDIHPMEMVRQLTLIDFELFKSIPISEISSQAWNKPGMTPHVTAFIDRFNELSYWVATEVVLCANLKKRITVMKRFIEILEMCKQVQNYNAVMAILSGLNLGCVSRLKTTWSSIPKQSTAIFEEMSALMESSGNYRNYRKELLFAKPPIVPYFAVFLRDLTFIEDGNKDFIKEDIVNFQKMRMLAKAFSDVRRYQTREFQFQLLEDVRKFLTEAYVMRGEKQLYKYSRACEPPASGIRNSSNIDSSPSTPRRGSLILSPSLPIAAESPTIPSINELARSGSVPVTGTNSNELKSVT